MSSPRHRTAVTASILVAGLALALAGCAPASNTATTTSTGTVPAESPTTPAETATPAQSTGTGPATGTAAAPLCTAANLAGSVDDTGGGAAGHIYFKLIVKNTSGASCLLNGYPGVSLVLTGMGGPLGAPADRDASLPSKGPITLAPGNSAAAQLRYTQAGNYQDCTRVQANGIRVYPPSATDSLYIAHPLTACSNTGIKLLTIGAFQP
ncbi:DUF4232 domain-containing protein [Specibacter cremeus]|uniref:DUF4232 domain-containing protein n=1 Tax=Specibacter cremeus TaxID=1629051 RepID=UPI000F798653|nr:DUF4232 domain-containing protein [Specibacter cremeus]